MKARLALLAFALALAGCVHRKAPDIPLSTMQVQAPVQQGLFMVSAQKQRRPTVVIANNSSVALRMLLNQSDGTLFKLDVSAHSEGRIDVPKGHYEAKVYDVGGRVKSAYGSADIDEYRTYKMNFVIKYGANPHFHIGEED